MVQWLRLCASTAGGMGSIPGQGTQDPACCSVRLKKKKKTGDSIYNFNFGVSAMEKNNSG